MVMGAVLLSTAWSNHRRVNQLSTTLTRGQGELLFDNVRRIMHEGAEQLSASALDEVLDELAGQGLRYVAIRTPRGEVTAGEATIPRPLPGLREREPVSFEEEADRIRMIFPLPKARPPRAGGRDSRRGRLGRRGRARDWRHLDRHRLMIIEFEPIVAGALRAQAAQFLSINALAALLLLVGAGLGFRWLRRQELREASQRRQRHLATLGEMSAVLAHEIRNPLASLKGHAQLLAEALPDSGREHDKAERVVREAIRLEHLTGGLLQFVRTGELQRAESDPAAIVRAAIDELAGLDELADRALSERVEVDDASAPATWSLDSDRMHEVIANLVRNALQASPPDLPVSVRVAAEAGALVYEVRDRGDGIPTGQEEAIFEPFQTSRVRGTGLGLAVARRVVELHGGVITAAQHPAGGALFRVVLPKRS
ncbi:MAG: hypothetical protein Tsb0020_43650 [Haliangiales bacterium]